MERTEIIRRLNENIKVTIWRTEALRASNHNENDTMILENQKDIMIALQELLTPSE